ncbi:hypothetical protein GOV06_03380 [Candidatus Woesearchaeota archaeon]|nr:hypothetical protein [Candidatus Woesearchaeota archaeon]
MTINKGKTNEELVKQYLARKKARKEKPEPVEEPLEEPLEEEENGLVYAILNQVFLSTKSRQNPVYVINTGESCHQLCYHDGELYHIHSTKGKISNTLTNEIVRERDKSIIAMCSHNGKLVDAMFAELPLEPKPFTIIYNTETNEELARPDGIIYRLRSHKGELYAAIDNTIIKTLTNERRLLVDFDIKDFCFHKNELYYTESRSVYHESSIMKGISEKGIFALCSHNGRLLDAGSYDGIYDTFDKKVIIPDVKKVTTMCSVPPEMVKRILKK